VYSHEDLVKYLKRTQVAVLGSGAWACAAARMVAQNTASKDPANEFASEVKMWVYEEEVEVCCLH
jgi:glycerol-3-phosphate dehydrogenase (NAD+)